MVDAILPDLDRLSLVALSFPKFGDGRAFSKASILRGQHGFKGEIRAVGDVLWDQLQLMRRCGFDAFLIENEPTLKALDSGKTPVMTDFYQPGHGAAEQPADPRAALGVASGRLTAGSHRGGDGWRESTARTGSAPRDDLD